MFSVQDRFAARPACLNREPRFSPRCERRPSRAKPGRKSGRTPSAAQSSGSAGAPSIREEEAIARVHRAIEDLEGVRARKQQVIARTQPKLEPIPTRFRPGSKVALRVRKLQGEIEDAFREEGRAEEEVIEAIRAASPGGGDPVRTHSFHHIEGQLYIVLPDGYEVDCDRILIVNPGQRVDLPPQAESR